VDRFGLESTLITAFDYGVGSHSAYYIETPGQPNFLYDPAGSYQPTTRGEDGIFEGKDANLQDYINYQRSTGSKVEVVKIPTTPEQEALIRQRAEEIGDPRGFSCATSVSAAISGVCRMKPTWRPGVLYDEAKNAKCGK
jgi:hypothetical protein